MHDRFKTRFPVVLMASVLYVLAKEQSTLLSNKEPKSTIKTGQQANAPAGQRAGPQENHNTVATGTIDKPKIGTKGYG